MKDRDFQIKSEFRKIPVKSSAARMTEHSQVTLDKPLPKLGLEQGTMGVVVHVYKEGSAYEVEFLDVTGKTICVRTVEAAYLRSTKE